MIEGISLRAIRQAGLVCALCVWFADVCYGGGSPDAVTLESLCRGLSVAIGVPIQVEAEWSRCRVCVTPATFRRHESEMAQSVLSCLCKMRALRMIRRRSPNGGESWILIHDRTRVETGVDPSYVSEYRCSYVPVELVEAPMLVLVNPCFGLPGLVTYDDNSILWVAECADWDRLLLHVELLDCILGRFGTGLLFASFPRRHVTGTRRMVTLPRLAPD